MIGVDYGTKEIKWFDGKRFGKGLPKRRGSVVGLSSAGTLVKEATFPLCKGRQLEKLVISEVTADLSVAPSSLSVAYCPIERLEKGCKLLIFVEKREVIDSLPPWLKESSTVTLDLVGTISAVNLLYKEGRVTALDLGEGKVSLLRFEEGKIREVEVFRGGFRKPETLKRAVENLEEGEKVVLIGGGALQDGVKDLLKGVTVEVPEFEPFGEETPLYFNAFGLYHFKRSPCRALFSQPSLLSSQLLGKNRKVLIRAGTLTLLSLLLLTAGEVVRLQAAKRDYAELKEEVKRELSDLLGQKVLLPEVQIPQKLQELKELKEFLKVDQPSALTYLKAISESVVEGIKVLEVRGSASSEEFVVIGKGSQESLEKFIKNLKEKFQKVSISSTGEKTFKITLWRVKVGT